uniref:hypothetical protein n=1 Tax=Roseivirga sp. TaxID=1964215 RepID=UPI004047A2E5
MKRKIKFLSIIAIVISGLSIPTLGNAECWNTVFSDGSMQTVCEDGTVTSHSTLQPNGGCAGAAEDCHNMTISEW